jgi:hypothetical protein
MFVRIILAGSTILLATLPVAAAEDCQSLQNEERQAVIRKAPTCDKAMVAFGDCAFGASGDTGLGQIVTEKCQGDFLEKLRSGQKHGYERGIKRCNDKYARKDGTMYVAMAAYCRAQLAQTYSRKYGKSKSR